MRRRLPIVMAARLGALGGAVKHERQAWPAAP